MNRARDVGRRLRVGHDARADTRVRAPLKRVDLLSHDVRHAGILEDSIAMRIGLPGDIVKDVRGSESNCEHDSRKM